MNPDFAGRSRPSLRLAVQQEHPLQVVGVINALSAMLAERAGFRALYLSGAGVANASHGLPDLGMTSLADVLEDACRITSVTCLPLLVDIDTGWGNALTIHRAIVQLSRAGVAGVHLEDQADAKRCGHRTGKQLVPTVEMVERVRAAVDARQDDELVVMARTDAVASEGLARAIERSQRYVEAGADMIFAEAVTSLADFREFASQVDVPVLANMTEFGKTPMFRLQELREAGISLALYPLTAFRAMNAAAERVYRVLRTEGDQSSLLDSLQTRQQLYDVLDYETWELRQDRLSASD